MRSLLFVPGDDERKIAKGLASAADALILDLEDAVAPQRKAAARELCAATLAAAGARMKLFIRINALDTPAALLDLAAVVKAGPFGIMLPKCRNGEDARLLSHYLTALEAREGLPAGEIRILPIVTETGGSLFGFGGLSGYDNPLIPRLCGMLWGGEDLAADLGAITNRDEDGRYAAPYLLARSLCLFASASASVIAVDAVYTNFRDPAGLKQEAVAGLRSGFSAKAAIHPDQIAVINEAFTPTAADVESARRVIEAFDASPGAGVVAVDGKMLDRPHYRTAQRVLARARQE